MPSAESLVDLHEAAASEKDDVDSLPSDSTSELYSEADSDAQAEWERSLEQLQLLLTMLIVPWMGKYFGRKFAYWSKQPVAGSRTLQPPVHHQKHAIHRVKKSSLTSLQTGWARYMEWAHNLEVRWTNKKAFKAVGAVEAATAL
ncbi:hypothetical protein HJFPF1_03786 [Paramyrothecium foliicola]|nr:hypothetical protein HJFPF1_03786 [Paramyrothecium foliicola]